MNESVRIVGVGIGLILAIGACSGGAKPVAEQAQVTEPKSPIEEGKVSAVSFLAEGTAIVLSGGKLLAMVPGSAPNAKPKVLASARYAEDSGFPWCAVDNRAQVVWFRDDSGLNALDLLDAQTRLIVGGGDGDFGVGEVLIDHGDAGQLGATETLSASVRLAVHLTDGPVRIEPSIACEGDAAWYCYTDIPEKESEEWILLPELAAREVYLRGLSIKDSDYLQKVATRSNARSLFASPTLGEKLPNLKSVQSKYCVEDPDQCGTAERITEQLWRVEVYNDRGDFYHRSDALYDSTKMEYIDIKTGLRSAVPSQEEVDGIAGVFVSANGKYILSDKALLSLDSGARTEHHGTACGFVGSGSHLLP